MRALRTGTSKQICQTEENTVCSTPVVKPLRIGIVIGQLTYGGAERQVELLAKQLNKFNEYEPMVFCMSQRVHPYAERLIQAGIDVYAPDSKTSIVKLLWLVQAVKSTDCKLLYGILHIGNVYGGAAAAILNLPFIGSIRNADKTLSLFTRSLSGFFCKHANAVVANSHSCLEALNKDLGVRHNRSIVIPNIVEVANASFQRHRHSLRTQWNILPDHILIGTIALLKKQKRPDFFIEVFLAIAQRFEAVHFIWVGDGPEKSQVIGRISKLDANLQSRLHFVGYRQDVYACLAAFDTFILTSAYEGLPNALLEAMAMGKPCIATRVPGTVDVFQRNSTDTEIGILADAHSSQLFAKDLGNLLEQPAQMKEIGINAHKFIIENYSSEKITMLYQSLIHKIMYSRDPAGEVESNVLF